MLTIKLTAANHAVLDESLAKVAALAPAATISVLARAETGEQVRQLSISEIDDKLLTKLSKLDIPHAVSISVRQ